MSSDDEAVAALCIYEKCERPRSDRLSAPLCTHHARLVYMEVRDLLENASVQQLADSARTLRHGRKPAHYSSQPGEVYFARCGELVKIGFSTNVRKRIADIGADELLASFRGTRQDERAMHARFGLSWSHGEYFLPSPDLSAFIESIGRA